MLHPSWSRWTRVLALVFSVLTTPLLAQNTQPQKPSNTEGFSLDDLRKEEQPKRLEEYDFWSEFAHMLYYLGGILLFMLLAAWMFRRMMHTRMQQMNVTSSIKILERRSLTPKSSLYLLDIVGKGVVIAETPAGISLVTDLPRDLDLSTLQQASQSSFADLLQKGKTNETEE